jgi:hypothetical protein
MRQRRGRILADQRILGTGDFVERIVRESSEQMRPWVTVIERREKMQRIIETIYTKEKVNVEELRMGSRRGVIPQVRTEIAEHLVRELGMPFAEVGRALGVSTSAISKLLTRRNQNISQQKST